MDAVSIILFIAGIALLLLLCMFEAFNLFQYLS